MAMKGKEEAIALRRVLWYLFRQFNLTTYTHNTKRESRATR
ncbi:unnamed protein product [Callosobruchus maculatus]|uniref:Uncharacterized protein n=1 Tax=Callosobruchus maculatus TaxID=64391 RepID=A0A653CH95_CALMS|nr:unnamed protein product [Callosobruchus maculatus]